MRTRLASRRRWTGGRRGPARPERTAVRWLVVLAAASMTCGNPRHRGAQGSAPGLDDSTLALVANPNPDRGTDGTGPLQSLGNHIISNIPAANEPYYYTSGTIDASSGVKDGSYTYSVPIHLPDGIAGLKPSLSLDYSSNSGNGVVGVGWTIGGMSAISRCAHKFSRDGFASGFDFNRDHSVALNQYCLDGNELVPISRTDTQVVYQTENADFASVVAYYDGPNDGDPDYFVVHQRDGLDYWYGADSAFPGDNANSRADGPLGGVTTDPAKGHWTYAWYLTRIEDRDHNVISYTYLADLGSYYARINSVVAQNSSSRLPSTISYGNTVVTFDYAYADEARPDVIESFEFGFDLTIVRRLKTIYVDVPGHVVSSGSPATWTYMLDYALSAFTNRSELTSIRLMDVYTREVPPTTFTWNAPPTGSSSYSTGDYKVTAYPMGPPGGYCSTNVNYCLPSNFTRVMLLDLNGDGLDDVVYSIKENSTHTDGGRLIARISSPTGLGPEIDAFPSLPAESTIFLDSAVAVDLNGDGKSELIWPYASKAFYSNDPTFNSHLQISQWTNNGFTTLDWAGTILDLAVPLWQDASNLANPNAITVTDFNGDAIPDIMSGDDGWLAPYPNPGHQNIFLGKLVPGSFDFLPGRQGPPGYNYVRWDENYRPSNFETAYVGDVDGDARADIIRVAQGTQGLMFADLNGDGLVEQIDVSGMEGQADCGSATITLAVKENFGRLPAFSAPAKTLSATASVPGSSTGGCASRPDLGVDYTSSVRVADFNGDGIQDLLFLNAGLDAGTQFSSHNYGSHPGTNRFFCRRQEGDQTPFFCGWDLNRNRDEVYRYNKDFVMPINKGHFTPPVLLLSKPQSSTTSIDPAYVPVVLPLAGGRVREERYAYSQLWEIHANGSELQAQSPTGQVLPNSKWSSHYWSGTAVGDIDGDGLADVVQIALAPDGGSVQLETITAKKADLGLPNRRDLIVEVKDGLRQFSPNGDAFAEQIAYTDLSTLATSGKYTQPATCIADGAASHTSCAAKGVVVDSLKPAGRRSGTIHYTYAGARFDRKGRGFLGFDTAVATDDLFGRQTRTDQTINSKLISLTDDFGLTTYASSTLRPHDDTHFPGYVYWNDGSSSPPQSRVYYVNSSSVTTVQTDLLVPNNAVTPAPLKRTVASTTNELITNIPNGTSYAAKNTFHVRPKKTTVTSTYLTAARAATDTGPNDVKQTVDFTYDTYSNPWKVTTTTSPDTGSVGTGGSTDIVTKTYNNLDSDPNGWIIGQLNNVTHERRVGTSDLTRTTAFTYHADGRLWTEEIEPSGLDVDLHRTTWLWYYSNGNLEHTDVIGVDAAASSTPQARTTKYTYDATHIYPATIADATGTTTLSYDPAYGVLLSVVDPNGIGTDFVYDGFGRKKGAFPDAGQATFLSSLPASPSVDPALAYRQSTWQSVGTLPNCAGSALLGNRCFAEVAQLAVDLRGDTLTTSTRGFETQAQNGQWWDVTSVFDDRNRLANVAKPTLRGGGTSAPQTQYTYDGLDRLITLTNPDGSTRTWTYTNAFKTKLTDEHPADVTQTVDVDGQLVLTAETVKDTNGSHDVTTSFVRDAFGNITTSTRTGSGTSRTTTFASDLLGRHITTDDPASGTTSIEYNAFGEIRREVDPSGKRDVLHDAVGRITKRVSETDPTIYETYTWDTAEGAGIGKLASTKSMPDNVLQEYGYNALGQAYRQILTTGGQRYQVHYLYDSEGRLFKVQYPQPAAGVPSQFKAQYNYDDYGRLSEITTYNPTSQSLWRLVKSTPLQQIEAAGDGTTTTSTFDSITRRLSEVDIATPSAVPATKSLSYTYFPTGDVKTRAFVIENESYDYDELHRLKTWSHTATGVSFRRQYTYNDFGDLTGTSTFNALTGGTMAAQDVYTLGVTAPRSIPSALKSDGTNTYAYDVNGRRKTKTTGSAVETTVYNHWNLPTSITSPNTTSPTQSLTFLYDALGARVAKTYNGDTTYYLGDVFEDRIVSGAHNYVMRVKAGGKTVAIASQPAAGTAPPVTLQYPQQDGLGSTLALTAAPISTSFFYEPFGARVARDGKTAADADTTERIDFAGHEHDPTGYINMRGRIYDPSVRRFISPDPIVSDPTRSQGYNPFAYVRNNPVNRSDRWGFDDGGGDAGGDSGGGETGDEGDGGGGDGSGDDNPYGDLQFDPETGIFRSSEDECSNCTVTMAGGGELGMTITVSGYGPGASGPTPTPGAPGGDGPMRRSRPAVVAADPASNTPAAVDSPPISRPGPAPAPDNAHHVPSRFDAMADVGNYDHPTAPIEVVVRGQRPQSDGLGGSPRPAFNFVSKFSLSAGIGPLQASMSAVDSIGTNGPRSFETGPSIKANVSQGTVTKPTATGLQGSVKVGIVMRDNYEKLASYSVTINPVSAEFVVDEQGTIVGVYAGVGTGFGISVPVDTSTSEIPLPTSVDNDCISNGTC